MKKKQVGIDIIRNEDFFSLYYFLAQKLVLRLIFSLL